MIKNFLRTALLLSFSVTTFISKAQKSDSTVTIIFAGDRSKTSKTTKRKAAPQNNIIKVAPTGIFVGQIPLIYERKLTSSISVQVSAGLTAQNYIRTLFAKASQIASDGSSSSSNLPWADQAPGASDYAEDIYNFERRKAEMGTMFSIQPKFYLDDDALDGSYVGFSFSNYNYKFSTPGAKYSSSSSNYISFTGPLKNESEKITDFMIHYGHQGINGHFSIEYSSAIGLRKVSGEKYGATYDYSGTNKIYDGMIQYSKTLFNYEFAIRVGYVF